MPAPAVSPDVARTAATDELVALGASAVVVVDHGVARHQATERLVDGVRRTDPDLRILTCSAAPTTADVRRLAGVLAGTPGATVVAIGGGATMDTAALAAAWADDDAAERRCVARQRGGLVVLPSGILRTRPLVCVPTTLGTGAEASRSACFVHDGARRLVIHEGFRADRVVYDADLLESLPSMLVQEALLEVFFRLSTLVIGARNGDPDEDAERLAAVRELVRLGQSAGSDTRTRLAVASAQSHGEALMTGGDPFAGKGWYVATEVADAGGTRKVSAFAAILPVVFDLIVEGRSGWGDAGRLERLWAVVRDESTLDLPASPADGLRALVARWGIPATPIAPADVEHLAHRIAQRWGGGLPMLSGLRTADIRELLSRVANGHGERTQNSAGQAP